MDKEHRMLEARLLQAKGLTQKEIAETIGKSERTVRYYLKQKPGPRKNPVRGSKVDPFKPMISQILKENPSYNSEILFERISKIGYTGKISVMKDYVAQVRKQLAIQAVMRFETEPARQAQVDWKEFGKQIVDGKETKLYAFVMVLGYSRKAFVRFTTRMDQATLLACHTLAFDYFGGIPHEILYDNMRAAFTWDEEGVFKPTVRLLALAIHYDFLPKRCRVRRPETKGKVERTIGYLGNNFWPRMDGSTLSLEMLNTDVVSWLSNIDEKPLTDFTESRLERFAREKPLLKILPARRFDARHEIPLGVNRESMISYETNRYSVPPEWIGKLITLKVDPLSREAEIFGPKGSLRQFTLQPAGARQRVFFPEDRELLRRRWVHDRQAVARRRVPRRRLSITKYIDVEVRSPAAYAIFAEEPEVRISL
ncbi:IS21 family transposase [Tepidanaerobacter syntrophicus]|uniref:IS21 family transposase n=1 Tax=Tepidanaerobacter syntrophicus TaxID=224999 RepID=UPI001BD2E2A4|nr:IS21 family transposase [Tepidanaerobacter syntrophicus]